MNIALMIKKLATLHGKTASSHLSFLAAGLLLCVGLAAFAEEQAQGGLYAKQTAAVYLVNQAIYVDSNKVSNPALFKKLEEAMGKKLLDQYIPIASGTAFLINEDGTMITAAHVLKYIASDWKTDSAMFSFLQYVSKNILPGALSQRELHFVCAEFVKLAKETKASLEVRSAAHKDYPAQVLGRDDKLDLALLKIDLDEKVAPIAVSEDIAYEVGDQVISIGFPLPSIMDQFLETLKPSITNGIISAIRDDAWDIQHTASINSGNSGGPLLSADGRLIGVNLGMMNNANNIYFATNAKKVFDWLNRIGRTELINGKN